MSKKLNTFTKPNKSNNSIMSNQVLWISVVGAALLILIVAAAVIESATHSDITASIATNDTAKKPASGLKIGNKIGDLAPDFTLMTIDGKTMNLYDYKGKNIILNFWATWCGPCTFEVPFFIQIDETWAKAGVAVIAVNTQDNIENAALYAKRNNLNFLIPVDPRGGVATLFNVRGLPTTFFIDSEGVIKSVKVGPFINTNEIEERMSQFK